VEPKQATLEPLGWILQFSDCRANISFGPRDGTQQWDVFCIRLDSSQHCGSTHICGGLVDFCGRCICGQAQDSKRVSLHPLWHKHIVVKVEELKSRTG
jgi:hypothetical protein